MIKEVRNGDVIRRRKIPDGETSPERKLISVILGEDKLTRKIGLAYMYDDGEVGFIIRDKLYRYRIDTGHFPEIYKLSNYTPGKALNFVKKHGELIESDERR